MAASDEGRLRSASCLWYGFALGVASDARRLAFITTLESVKDS